MRAIILGKGLIGKVHSKALSNLGVDHKFLRSNDKALDPDMDLFGLDQLTKYDPTFGIISSPTSLHIEHAIILAKKGIHLFIEKPLSNHKKGWDELVSVVKSARVSSYVAYVLRFHPALIYIKDEVLPFHRPLRCAIDLSNHLPAWNRTGAVHDSYSAYLEQGGGVLFDLSHELDYVTYLFGGVRFDKIELSRIGRVTVNAPDYFLGTFMNDEIKGTIRLDYFSHEAHRTLRIDFEDFTLFLEMREMRIRRYEGRELVDEVNFSKSFDDLYRDQLSYFMQNIDGKIFNNLFEAEELMNTLIDLHQNFPNERL
jgi:predicted dehydrogenase